MIKADEHEYYAAIQAKGRGVFADVVAERLGMEWGRAESILEKWTRRGWWEWGVSIRSGWLTDTAPQYLPQK